MATGDTTSLQSKDHRDLLDVVDRLRSQGLGRFVDLPQIIVCGDQSSGKSSALEAISGMSFPAKDNLCTRFATELILRRVPKDEDDVDICIIPGAERTEEEKEALKKFTYVGTLADLDLGKVVEDAKVAMGLGGNVKVFSTDILRIEISGPSQPHLTMVDLPGLFLAGNKDQSQEDAALVEALVLSYMKKPRTIILAVVSAKSDFALQQVTKHARALDPQGDRTLGLITKPDTLDKGSDSERFFVELAQNKDVQFRLGWHVLRNRNYAERNNSTAARDAAETAFFCEGIWTSLKPSQLGVAALRMRLSHVLRDQILKQLPSVLEDVSAELKDCRDRLARLGVARGTLPEQRRYLLKVSAAFSELTGAAVHGVYTDGFFQRAYTRRLRAVVQNTLTEFATDMHTKGHARHIVDDAPKQADCHEEDYEDEGDSECKGEEEDGDGVGDEDGPGSISRSTYIEEVKALMKETRGRELPGTYNPLIVTELFRKQCEPWQGLARSLVEEVFAHAFATVESIVRHVADGETAATLLQYVVNARVEEIKNELSGKVEELLKPHMSGHPITYNHYLTDNVQKAQATRSRKLMETELKAFFGYESWKPGRVPNNVNIEFDMYSLLNKLAAATEPDMDTYACSMAADMMQAYYKVRLSINYNHHGTT